MGSNNWAPSGASSAVEDVVKARISRKALTMDGVQLIHSSLDIQKYSVREWDGVIQEFDSQLLKGLVRDSRARLIRTSETTFAVVYDTALNQEFLPVGAVVGIEILVDVHLKVYKKVDEGWSLLRSEGMDNVPSSEIPASLFWLEDCSSSRDYPVYSSILVPINGYQIPLMNYLQFEEKHYDIRFSRHLPWGVTQNLDLNHLTWVNE